MHTMTDQQQFVDDESHLEALQAQFMVGLECTQAGHLDRAAELFRNILKKEPRLAEPRMELARLLLDTGQVDEASEQLAEAISVFEKGGQWIDGIPENTVLSAAYALLGESFQRQANVDEVVFGQPEKWKRLMEKAKAAFARAKTLDPENTEASIRAADLGAEPTESP
jgi:tetratricopeptide (TPR) repeat protein